MKEDFSNESSASAKMPIQTTVGDLICAIADAAHEARIEDGDVAELTHYILFSMLDRYQHQIAELPESQSSV